MKIYEFNALKIEVFNFLNNQFLNFLIGIYNGVIMAESRLFFLYIWTLEILASFATVSTKYFL